MSLKELLTVIRILLLLTLLIPIWTITGWAIWKLYTAPDKPVDIHYDNVYYSNSTGSTAWL